jgi:protein O-GlcNAc transferase
MRHHDRAQFQFYCFSDVANPDSITAELKNLTEFWRPTHSFSHARLCEIIRLDRIDILFDLTLHMNGNRMLAFAAKPAPVQITWAGSPGTTGLDTIDYRLTDPHLDPPGETEQYYSEHSLRLPASFWCLDEKTLDDPHTPAVNSLPAIQYGRITFGCLNNFAKVNQKTLNLWRRVLDAVANSRMILLAPPGNARDWVRKSLGERVEFVQRQPQEAYLRAYNDIDIGLDTFPYTGHMTTLDSLWMGVPVLTLTGDTAVSRGGASILRNLALQDLVASSQDQFVAIAAGLAGDLPRLSTLRSEMRQRMRESPLMDGPAFARDFQSILRQLWRSWCGGTVGNPVVSLPDPRNCIT